MCSVAIEKEPTLMSLAPGKLGTAAGSAVEFFSWGSGQQAQSFLKKEHATTVKKLSLNAQFAGVLLENGRLLLSQFSNPGFEKRFPETDNDKTVISFTLTNHFLIYIDAGSRLRYYNLADQAFILDFKKEPILQKLYANFNGTKLVLVDNNNQGYLFLAREE